MAWIHREPPDTLAEPARSLFEQIRARSHGGHVAHLWQTLASDPPLRMLQILVRPYAVDLEPKICVAFARRSSHAARTLPLRSAVKACRPSRAAPATSLITPDLDHVLP